MPVTDATSQSSWPIVRNETLRLSSGVWGSGGSVWGTDGVTPVVDQLEVTEAVAPAEVARALGVSLVWRRSRRYLVGGAPVMLAVSHVPGDLAVGTRITELDSGPGGVFARLAEVGHGPVWFSEDVWADNPSDEEQDRLRIDYGVPVLRALRAASAQGGRVVEVSQMVMVSYALRLRFEFPA